MSDEPSSSAAAPYSSHDSSNDAPEQKAAPAAAELAERRKTNRRMFNKKRGELLDDLIRSLDTLVYAELSTIYYMDCSFLRFLIRAFCQFVLLTPKPLWFPEPPQNRPYVGVIFGSNLVCLLIHIWFNAPSAGEATRGYLHGGLAMDFIGQQGPTSKLHLVLLDMLVATLQVVQMAAHVVRLKLKDATPAATATVPASSSNAAATAQDLDAEERGLRRSVELEQRAELQGDIEMQTLNPAGTVNASDSSVEARESALEDTSERDALTSTSLPRSDAHIFDAFHSGQIVLADLDLVKTITSQFWAHWKAAPESESSRRRRNVLGAHLFGRVGRVAGLRLAAGGRTVGV